MEEEFCTWSIYNLRGVWLPSCCEDMWFLSANEHPTQSGYKYCPSCGKKVSVDESGKQDFLDYNDGYYDDLMEW